MTASPPPPTPPLIQCLREVRSILERARRSGDVRDVEQAIERINQELDRKPQDALPPAPGRAGEGRPPNQ